MALCLDTLAGPARAGLVPPASAETAFAYDAVGEDYLRYADGSADSLFDFTSRYSFADRQIWAAIDRALRDLRAAGRDTVTILDAGCGPGTWLIRAVTRAHGLGFRSVVASGFDISPEMIRLARDNGACRGDYRFEVGDLEKPIPMDGGSVDLTLCLYGVLNHLPRAAHAPAAAELARVTRGQLFVTVRTVGSLPTIYVDRIEKARAFRQDHAHDRFEVDFDDGRHLSFTSHLFSAGEFRGLFDGHARIAGMTGLDLFHSRFSAHPAWNPSDLPYAEIFEQELCLLEERCGRNAAFMDRAAHILLQADCAA